MHRLENIRGIPPAHDAPTLEVARAVGGASPPVVRLLDALDANAALRLRRAFGHRLENNFFGGRRGFSARQAISETEH